MGIGGFIRNSYEKSLDRSVRSGIYYMYSQLKEEQPMTEYTLQLSREQMENLLTILDGRYDISGLEDEMDTDHFEFVVSLIYKEILRKLG